MAELEWLVTVVFTVRVTVFVTELFFLGPLLGILSVVYSDLGVCAWEIPYSLMNKVIVVLNACSRASSAASTSLASIMNTSILFQALKTVLCVLE